jgi:uncharacterized surface protein with fasciclin (FAS1) repeats
MASHVASDAAGQVIPRHAEKPWLPEHLAAWLLRHLVIYLGAATAGIGMSAVWLMVQPLDRRPDPRPVPSHAQALPGPVQQARPSSPPARPADVISDAVPTRQGLVLAQSTGDGADRPQVIVPAQTMQRERLLAAVREAASAATPGQTGPLTVFVPAGDASLARLVSPESEARLSPQDKSYLLDELGGHVVAGSFSMATFQALARTTGKSVVLKTLNGGHLTVKPLGADRLVVRDDRGVEFAMAQVAGQPNDGLHVFDQLGPDVGSGWR